MAFIKLQFRPGINRNVTRYTNEGGWYDCDKIRFRDGFPEQIKGWTRFRETPIAGRCRALHPWVTLDNNKLLGAGTTTAYYVHNTTGFHDITPIDFTEAMANPFTATNGSTTLTITFPTPDLTQRIFVAGSYVTFSGAVGLGGNVTAAVLNTRYQLVTVSHLMGTTTCTVEMSVTANATDAAGSPGGGAAVSAAFEVYPDKTSTQLRLWEHDNYGEDLLYNIRDYGIYYWAYDPSFPHGVRLSSLPGANTTPTIAKQVLVSDRDRHIIAFGCDDEFTPGVQDPLLIRFSDQESLTDWASTATNTAGSLRLGAGSEIVCAVETRQQTLVFTDTSLYAMQYVGPPYTFGVNMISEGITIASPNAAAAVGDSVFWMGNGTFYVYDGAVRPLECTVRDRVFFADPGFVYSDVSPRIVAGVNSSENEVWWFYSGPGAAENDRYVVYNYAENLWYYGSLRRTAWIDRGIFDFPIAAYWTGAGTNQTILMNHENGYTNADTSPATAVSSSLVSSPIEIGEGDQFMFVSRLVPDVDLSNSLVANENRYVELGLVVNDYPKNSNTGAEFQRFYDVSNVSSPPYQGQLFYRMRGRMLEFSIRNTVANVFWRLGSPRVDVRPDGRR